MPRYAFHGPTASSWLPARGFISNEPKTAADEAAFAYKDIESVMALSSELVRPVTRLRVVKALARLDDRDRFSIVVYDDQIDLVVESTPASAEARRNAIDRLVGMTT